MKKPQVNKKLIFIIPITIIMIVAVIITIGLSSASTDRASYLINDTSSASCKSNCVQIVPSGALIRAVELTNGSSTNG